MMVIRYKRNEFGAYYHYNTSLLKSKPYSSLSLCITEFVLNYYKWLPPQHVCA